MTSGMPDFDYIAEVVGLEITDLLKNVWISGYNCGQQDAATYVNNGNPNV
jgi:hypothetical protein